MKVLYLARDDGTEYRGVKTCNSLVKLGYEVVFVGWDRVGGAAKTRNLVPDVKTRVLRRPGILAQNSLQGWGAYVRHIVRSLYEERPDAIHTVNEDAATLVVPYKRILYRHLIMDVHDSVIANRRPGLLNLAARVCRLIGNLAADTIIETGPELQQMLGWFARKSIIIENAPYDPGPELAERVPKEGPVRVHLGGYLSRRRMGLDTLLAAIDLLPPGSVIVEASGWLVDEYAKETFARHPAVCYRWLPKPIDFLNCAAACDALLYLRSDASESAYRAAVRPNRVFDALAVGRPLIVNPELAISRWVEEDKLGIVLPKFDAETLSQVFRSLAARRKGLAGEAARLRKVFLDGHVWPVMEQRLAALYGDCDPRRNAETRKPLRDQRALLRSQSTTQGDPVEPARVP